MYAWILRNKLPIYLFLSVYYQISTRDFSKSKTKSLERKTKEVSLSRQYIQTDEYPLRQSRNPPSSVKVSIASTIPLDLLICSYKLLLDISY